MEKELKYGVIYIGFVLLVAALLTLFFTLKAEAGISDGISSPVFFNSETTNQFNRLATDTPVFLSDVSWSLAVATRTTQGLEGRSLLVVYGTTTIQTPNNTLYALRILNAATSSVFQVDTVNTRIGVATSSPSTDLTVSGSGTTTASITSTNNGTASCIQMKDPSNRPIRIYPGFASSTQGVSLIVEPGVCK